MGTPINVPAPVDPAVVGDQALVSAGLSGFASGPVMTPGPGRAERVNESALIRDVWYVLAGAGKAPRTRAAARDAVFGRYLPMARTVATTPGPGSRPVDTADAEQVAELGLAQAVLGWGRPDGEGFEATARAAIAAQLRRLPATPGEPPGHRPPGDQPSPGQT